MEQVTATTNDSPIRLADIEGKVDSLRYEVADKGGFDDRRVDQLLARIAADCLAWLEERKDESNAK